MSWKENIRKVPLTGFGPVEKHDKSVVPTSKVTRTSAHADCRTPSPYSPMAASHSGVTPGDPVVP
eukprot:614421-Prymnesium_polylepis.3